MSIKDYEHVFVNEMAIFKMADVISRNNAASGVSKWLLEWPSFILLTAAIIAVVTTCGPFY